MPEEISPQKVQEAVKYGFERFKTYRKARTMFIKEFVGQYYSDNKLGLTGEEPINLIFQTIRSMVPNLVMQNPKNRITTNFLQQKAYGGLLQLALNQVENEMNLKDTLRGWIVAAIFGWGIVKTGLAAKGEMIQFGDMKIDPGQIYTKLVDLDDFVMDGVCNTVDEAMFMGSRIKVPRQYLLDTDGYNHDLVKKLPGSDSIKNDRAGDISKQNSAVSQMNSLQDFVDVVELWVPGANALVTIPDPYQATFDDYLRVTDYYGPAEGPYTFLSFSPPVPNNPFPIAPVSLWFDIHRMANESFKKIMDQARRQKDVTLYEPAQADEAQEIKDSEDGDVIASVNPKGVNQLSFGGQNRNNEQMLQQMQIWYNYISGNPDQMAGNSTPGTSGGNTTATQASILHQNSGIVMEDARNLLYDGAAKIGEKIAWYLHTDPLINLPLTKRKTGGQEIQLWLTPDQRRGDFMKFMFNIQMRSMSRLDPQVKAQRVMAFAVNVVPALIQSAQVAMQAGIQFNVQKAITDLAEEQDILDTVEDWFMDPDFQQKMAIVQAMGPQDAGKAQGSQLTTGAINQNGGPAQTRNVPTQGQQFNQNAQAGSAPVQQMNKGGV